MAKCLNCGDVRYVSVRVPGTRERALLPCHVCNPLPRDTRNVPAGTRPVAAGEWERLWQEEGVSHAG